MNRIKSALWTTLGAVVLITFFVLLGMAYTAATGLNYKPTPGAATPHAQTR